MAVWNIGIYSKSITETSKSVLLETFRILSGYREYLVLSGGWAPYFIIERFGEGGDHCGSIDIDLVLNPQLINLRVYETIVSLMMKRDTNLISLRKVRCYHSGSIALLNHL